MANDTMEISADFTIMNTLGLHARAAAAFVKIANRFQSDITVVKDESSVNGKSIMGVLMLAASKNSKISITAKGDDAKEAMEALRKLIEEKFGED
jgi:phosphocarrier protein